MQRCIDQVVIDAALFFREVDCLRGHVDIGNESRMGSRYQESSEYRTEGDGSAEDNLF